MIAWLEGKIIDKHPGKLILNVQGVGYDVEISMQSYLQLEHGPEQISLFIQTIVREDAFLLYGFLDKLERALFRALIKVNGIGPKAAMSILSSATPAEFIQSISQRNTGFLTKLPGIGKKTAERLVIEMKDSINDLIDNDALTTDRQINLNAPLHDEQNEAIRALEALGYKPLEASKIIKKIDDGTKTCEQLIRQALQLMAKH